MIPFHQFPADEVLGRLDTTIEGLTEQDVAHKRQQAGWNELPEVKSKPWLLVFLKQFKSLLVIVLLVAALISYLTHHVIDVYVILAVVLINAAIGFIQEIRAEKAVASLRKMLVQQARVIREGKTTIIPARDLVPGDIIVLEEGESIPADARIIQSRNLRTIEASLTGESVPVSKHTEALPEHTPLADRKNMLWKGTFVAGGYALAVVCGTGLQTAIGDIAKTLSEIRHEKTNFQRKTDKLARQMALIAIGSTGLLFFTGYFFGSFEMEELLLVSIAAMVSAIPEGLPAVISIVLAIGSRRMSKRNAIIREFTSVETLGSVTTIITDKTGTLTQNTLTVRKAMVFGEPEFDISGEGWFPAGNFYQHQAVVEPAAHPVLYKMLQIAACSNNADIRHHKEKDSYQLAGDPTEGALLVMARKAGLARDKKEAAEKLDDLPFDSKMKLRATLCLNHHGRELFVLGAPEKILELSTQVFTGQGLEPLDEESAGIIRQKIDEWSGNAMRVIGIAYKKAGHDAAKIGEDGLGELIFAGIAGMIDPPRPEAKAAVEKCKRAGIRVIMATGDHINTAIAIARATGIIEGNGTGRPEALTEQQLSLLDEREFDDAVSTVNVFARLTPKMKLRIAERLQARGELIAMTGDGVNDAPALKKADVGVAMGIMGTDVARDASKVVLADDNFATIVSAVEEGRIVFTNARQTSFFLVTTNFAEIATLITLVALGYPMPLTAIQLLWLNLVTDGVGDIALATEQGHGGELDEKPVRKKENILNRDILPFLLIMSGTMTVLCILVYFWFIGEGIEKTRTAVFITMATTQLFNLLNMRSLKKTVFEIGYFTNRYISMALAVSLMIQAVIIEAPFFQRIFNFAPMTLVEFLALIALSSSVLWIGEFHKFFLRRVRAYISRIQ